MKTVTVEITGVTSLLQHRFGEDAEAEGKKKTRVVGKEYGTPREQAEKVEYRDKNGFLYHPSSSIMALLRESGRNHKQKGSRRALKWIVPAAVRMAEDVITLYTNGNRADNYEVDSRPVVIPSTRGRVMRHRPRLDEWRAVFDLVINDEVLPEDTIHMLLAEGGQRIGIGDYRPEKGGPFGTFRITKWGDEISEE